MKIVRLEDEIFELCDTLFRMTGFSSEFEALHDKQFIPALKKFLEEENDDNRKQIDEIAHKLINLSGDKVAFEKRLKEYEIKLFSFFQREDNQ